MLQNKNSIYRKALFLAIPMMIQNGITNAVGLIDNIMVGSLGTESMTAVSIVGQLIFVFNLSIFGGLSGPGIYGAQYYGQGNDEGVTSIFRLKWWIALCVVALGIIVFLTSGDLLIMRYLQGNGSGIDAGETLRLAKQYMQVMLWGLTPFAITQIYAGSLRETGESVKPMIAGICSVIADVVFNYLLIYGKFGFPKMGVKGAAVATVIARFIELTVIVCWSHIARRKHIFLKGIYRTFLVPVRMVKPVILKGLPIFFNEFLWAGGIAVLTQCYSRRGLTVVAGINISNAICNLLNVVFVAMGNAVGILTGQMLGAQKYEEAKKGSVHLMWFTGSLCSGLTVILIIASRYFPLLYDTSAEVRSYGTYFIIITALFFPVQGFLNALYFTLRSGGKTIITFFFDSGFTWVVSVSLATILCEYTGLSIFMIYAFVQAADLIKVLVGYVLIKKGVWVTNLVDAI